MKFNPENMKVKICKACKGLGKMVDDQGNVFPCAHCTGSGRIVTQTIKEELSLEEIGENRKFDKETMKVKICKTCKGLGKFYGNDGEELNCMDCGGTGRYILHAITDEYQLHHIDELEVEAIEEDFKKDF